MWGEPWPPRERGKAKRVTSWWPKCWSILKKRAAEFSRETGLHGYKYISQPQRSKVERIVWTITVLASLFCALVLIQGAWNYFARIPTLTVIESTHNGIWHYPFPAITVCDNNRMSYNLAKKLVNRLKTPANLSKEFLVQEMRLMTELMVPGMNGNIEKNLTRLQDIIDDNNLSILDVLTLITTNCSTLIKTCKWRGSVGRCDKYFKKSLAQEGLCCSFNYLVYSDNTTPEEIKIASCGYETGMTILVDHEPNDYHASIIGSYGVNIMIHYSFDYPDFNAAIQMVRRNTQHLIRINPAMMYSKPAVRNLAISTRKCIFSDEADRTVYAEKRKNKEQMNLIFTKYSYHNCLVECRATIIRAKCGCIPYYFPQNSTRVCNLRDVQCLKRYQSFYDTSWPGLNLSYANLLHKRPNIEVRPCGCIPDCTLYRYPVQSSSGVMDSAIYYNDGQLTKNPQHAISILNHSIVHVFFNDLIAFQYRQSVNYSWRNLFATFGGLLGLCAGFSLMSILEFLYFLVIRVISDVYNLVKRNNIK